MTQAQEKLPPAVQLDHRYEGISKVTGTARYVAEFTGPFPKDMAYGFVVQSTIPNGTIVSIDQKAAERAPGVIAVLTPFNAPKLTAGPPQPPARRNLTVLQDNRVHYNGQPIAIIVASSLVEASQAARLLKIQYAEQPAKLHFRERLNEARPPKSAGKNPAVKKRGDVDAAMAGAAVVVDETYVTPIQTHNPMEPHATIAWWTGEKTDGL